MLKWSLSDYSDAYILFKWTITVPNTGTAVAPNNTEKNNIQKVRSIYWLHKQNKQYTNR